MSRPEHSVFWVKWRQLTTISGKISFQMKRQAFSKASVSVGHAKTTAPTDPSRPFAFDGQLTLASRASRACRPTSIAYSGRCNTFS
ncbi:hypothetical protein T4B_3945 [Trichinella pseudospiralis]|uniref:Uncharacterized protein n=2 Tax=Trichinella pseudospiralis TaxID=6337 RepID=A0A0V1J286_TRIPS|nr:hypothetical protein T4D_15915 [Trichinella pseudospiralis]KRZ22291.1 hypothetical protein T4B_3945 [Trichinella pseudospiralis]KRZ29078.1 hypothetical protein T4C_12772 [Trichinella pseudospiralis]